MDRAFEALGRQVVRLRWPIIVVWVLGTMFAVRALPSLSSQVNNDNSQFLPSSAPSNVAARLAEPLIGSQSQSRVPLVVVTSAPSLSPADDTAIQHLSAALRGVPTVKSVRFLAESAQHNAAELLVTSSTQPFGPTGPKDLVDRMESAIGRAGLPPDLHAHLAGAIATEVAVNQNSNKQGNLIQIFSILFIVVLLLVIFRSVLAPFATLLPAVLTLGLSGAFIGALGADGLKISFFTQILLIVLILGAGTDYGLFLVFRVREELLGGRSPHEAVATALCRVGESISASAGTVVVALLSLTLASFGIYHDLGIPLAIGIVVMLLAGLTFLPALLTVLGRALFWPSKTAPRPHGDGMWGQIAGRLVQRPVATLVSGVLVFGVLAAFASGFKPGGFGGQETAPAGTDVAAGNAVLTRSFPQASSNPTNVVMRFARPVWQDPGVLARATASLRASGAFTKLAGPLDPNGTSIAPAQLTSLHAGLPAAADLVKANRLTPPAGSSITPTLYSAYLSTARYVSADGLTVQWEAGLSAGDPGSTAALGAVPHIRDTVAAVARQAGAQASGVAGEAPAVYDVSNISDGDLRHIVPVAVIAIGIVLALVLRSLVAPLYLILSVVLSYLASLGLSVIFFIKLGASGGIVFLLPFLMFIFLLALGEDYNILVMTRIREEARRRPLRDAVVRAVGATGPTVTSAGLVLAGTFAVLAVVGGSGQGNGQVREIGFGLAVGILLDTFVVRTVLVPSTVSLLGRWNWWPSALSREPTAAGRAAGRGAVDGGDRVVAAGRAAEATLETR
ncbi:MAG TPA: MMPL family transporter [Acidimicrobiales bacterium]|nr:MMPL family transporter [Acidimicrobiales bacterium]